MPYGLPPPNVGGMPGMAYNPQNMINQGKIRTKELLLIEIASGGTPNAGQMKPGGNPQAYLPQNMMFMPNMGMMGGNIDKNIPQPKEDEVILAPFFPLNLFVVNFWERRNICTNL